MAPFTGAPKKRFGQNFLTDASVLDALVGFIAPHTDDTLVEIGPGRGALTKRLLAQTERLTAVEIDRDLACALKEAYAPRLTLIEADVLEVDFNALCPDQPLRIVGNLPYNISSPILFLLLEARNRIVDQHFMLQREVVERMVASPGSKAYGRLSVMLQAYYDMVKLAEIPPEAFHPAPKVYSAFVRMTPKATVPDVPFEDFSLVVKAAFAMRRKTLKNNLAGLLDEEELRGCGVDPGLRAEALDTAAFARLADRYAAKR